jgi:DNA-3-methyladenine glycosylase
MGKRHFDVRILPLRFYDRRTAIVARELLGKILRVKDNRVWRAGLILETEAYVRNDPANHAFQGLNKRNQSMFKGPGTVYVYKIHRVHCVNAVTRRGEAVLIRAIRPLENITGAADGPGKLCRAMNITRSRHDGRMLTGSEIQILDYPTDKLQISISKRVGVTKAKERMLRFFVKDAAPSC